MIEAVPNRLEGAPRQLRRYWSDEFKAAAVEQACQPGVNMSAVARRIGILPSQLYRWRRELLASEEAGEVAGPQEPPKPVSRTCDVIEIVIADVVVRAGADVDEAHLQRVIRAVRSA